MKLSLEEILEATKATIIKNDLVNENFTFSTDTRTIKEGEIYLPLKGENFDGEKFIVKAIEAGAAGYFTTTKTTANAKIILQVEDTLTAYLQLAQFYKRKINPKTVAITGSCGKTTTKEMAYCVASEKFKTHKSELNFNNEIGLCKTILSMPEDTEVLILEMGMRGLGEIELLSKYSEPDISIIANVGTAHIGRLGSRENIAKAKCEIVKYMKDCGLLIAHDDELIKAQRCKDAEMQSLYFSLNNVKVVERKVGYSKFVYKDNEYELNIEGDYNIENSLAVIEMGLEVGMTPKEINVGLAKYAPIEKRWDVQEIKGFKIINDSYNANPDSMIAVIKTVLNIYNPPILFVLGDMGELGENEAQYHKEIGDFLLNKLKNQDGLLKKFKKLMTIGSYMSCSCNTDKKNLKNLASDINVITVGQLAKEISEVLIGNRITSKNFENNLQTSRYILDNVKVGTTIVLKASRSMKFEEIIEEILNEKN